MTVKKAKPLEDKFEAQLKDHKLKGFKREYKFLADRKFRFDFAHPKYKVAVEIQGQIWKFGGHTSGYGLMRDAEKLALANIDGWTTFFITSNHVNTGEGINWVEKFINIHCGEK